MNNSEVMVSYRYFRKKVAKGLNLTAQWQVRGGLGWCVPSTLMPWLQHGPCQHNMLARCCTPASLQRKAAPSPSKPNSPFLSQNLQKWLFSILRSSFARSLQQKQDLCWFTLIPLAFQLPWLTGEKYFISNKWYSRQVDWLERDKWFFNITRGQILSGNFDGTLKLVSLEIQLNFFQFHLLSCNKYPHIYHLPAQTEVSLPVFVTS